MTNLQAVNLKETRIIGGWCTSVMFQGDSSYTKLYFEGDLPSTVAEREAIIKAQYPDKTLRSYTNTTSLGDYDKMLTMLTPGLGKISCVAKGARRQKSALLAGTQFLCFGEYMLFKGSETYTMNSCETIELFYNIRTDLDKLTYASHLTKIINDVTTENQNSYNTLKLFLNTLYMISETDKNELSLIYYNGQYISDIYKNVRDRLHA